MLQKMFLGIIAVVILISTSGCVTIGKKKDLEIQGLRGQISALESSLESKDQEIANLREDLDRAMQERIVPIKDTVSIEPKSRPNVTQIQTALRNAGYNPGKIDGRMGGQTREAIKSFQRANNITVDGKVGKKTWELLRVYLEKKVK
ncbi:MAG: peptidoglycan-binding domain-containing protein [Candidatus Omnitrophica bacterium]|jgi:murein L,D-transpeptidase YcbB/YkuD|nr:peptidoglycan-binding domain-containing protein [Candidatus Omnitrophota bacterium]